MNDDQVNIIIKANADIFKAALKQASNELKGFGDTARNSQRTVSQAWDNISSSVENVSKKVLTVSGGALAALGGFGVVYGKSLQDIQLSFQSLLGDSTAGSKMFGELYGLARKLPLAFSDIASSGKLLLAANIPAEQIVGTMQKLSLASISTGVDLTTLADTYATINGQAKVSNEQLERLAGAGIYNKLAQQVGMSQAEVRKAVTDGKISVEDFNAAVASMANKDDMARFEQSASRSFTSFQGSLKDASFALVGLQLDASGGLQVKAGGIFDQVVKGAADLAKTLRSPEVQDAISDVGNKISSVAKTVFPIFLQVISIVSQHIDVFAYALIGLAAALAAVKTVNFIKDVVQMGKDIGTVAKGVVDFAKKIDLVKVAQLAWSGVMKVVTAAQWLLNAALNANPIALIILAIAGLIAGLVLLWQNSETFRNIVTGVFDAVWGAIKFVWDWIKANWPLLLGILMGPIGLAIAWIIQNWDLVKAAFAAAWEFIKQVWSNVVAWFGNVWNGIVAVFAGVGNWFANIFHGAWNAITAVFAGVGGFFRGIWDAIVNIFGSIGTAIGNGISGAVKGVVNSILSGAENIINGFIGAINGAINTINKIPGVNIGKLGLLHLPRLATGGIVDATTGGRDITVAEGGENEWVVPESKMASVVRQLTSKSNQSAPQQAATYNQKFEVNVTVENDGTSFTYAQAVEMAKMIVRALISQGLKLDQMGELR